MRIAAISLRAQLVRSGARIATHLPRICYALPRMCHASATHVPRIATHAPLRPTPPSPAPCCVAANAFISAIAACPNADLLELVAWADATDSGAHVAASATACASTCFTNAVATLRAAVAGRTGAGCGLTRTFLYNEAQACATSSIGSCAAEDFALRALAVAEWVPLSRAVRIAADAALTPALRDTRCLDPCYNATMQALVNVSIAASTALAVYKAQWYPYSNTTLVEDFDIASDARLLLLATVMQSIMRRDCAKDNGVYCAVLLGGDYQGPDLGTFGDDPTRLDVNNVTVVFTDAELGVCSPCALERMDADATVADAVLRVYNAIGGTPGLAAISAVESGLALVMLENLVVAKIAAAIPAEVEALCGVSPSGATCLQRASAFGVNNVDTLTNCSAFLAAGAQGACPAACGAAFGALTASFGCCLGPLMKPVLFEHPFRVWAALGTLNFSLIADAAAACGSPLTECTVSSIGVLVFRVLNLRGAAVNDWSAAQLASFLAAFLQDVAVAINVDPSMLVLVSMTADGMGGYIIVLNVRASTAAGVMEATTQAAVLVSSGLATFPTAGAVAASTGSTSDGTSAVYADPAYATAGYSGAGGAALGLGVAAMAVAVAAWLARAA